MKPLKYTRAFHTNKMTTSGIWSRTTLEIRMDINTVIHTLTNPGLIALESRRRKKG